MDSSPDRRDTPARNERTGDRGRERDADRGHRVDRGARRAIDRQRLFAGAASAALVISLAFLVVDCRVVVPRQGWNASWGPLVPHETFPGDCSLCHVPERWDVLREDFAFDHEKETGYALRGAHESAACLRCHNDRGPVEAYIARGCGGCHADPHRATLGLECTRCHTESSWKPTGLIAEHARTRFPLTGAHVAAPCESCHPGAETGDFRGASTECEMCHRDNALAVKSPDHAAVGWIRNCRDCHTASGWGSAHFRHDFFPLSGGHGGLDCADCHTPGVFTNLTSDCNSCHGDDYQTAPNHVAGNFDRNCENCHNTSSWEGATFDHTFFPLTAGHSGLACDRCHTSGTTGPIPSDCYSCHSSDYQGAPDHARLSYPRTCEDCHTTTRWSGATFNHRFPLKGHHNEDCDVCHQVSTSTFTCLVCHAHRKSKMDDKHRNKRGYSYNSQACLDCHPDGKD